MHGPMNVKFFKNCPSASLPQRQIQLVVVLVSTELKLSHLVVFDIICMSEVTPINLVCFVLLVSLYISPVYHSLLFVSVCCAIRYGPIGCYLIAFVNKNRTELNQIINLSLESQGNISKKNPANTK
jgi:hypothetical protein